MKIGWYMWVYRQILATTFFTSHVIAAAALLLLLMYKSHFVLYLLDFISPITETIRNVVWGLFPIEVPKWIRVVGGWMGRGVRWSLSQMQVREQAVTRILLLDGFLLLTLMAIACNKILGLVVHFKVARWFNKRYVIISRKRYVELVAGRTQVQKKLATEPHHRIEPTLELSTPRPGLTRRAEEAIEKAVSAAEALRQAANEKPPR